MCTPPMYTNQNRGGWGYDTCDNTAEREMHNTIEYKGVRSDRLVSADRHTASDAPYATSSKSDVELSVFNFSSNFHS